MKTPDEKKSKAKELATEMGSLLWLFKLLRISQQNYARRPLRAGENVRQGHPPRLVYEKHVSGRAQSHAVPPTTLARPSLSRARVSALSVSSSMVDGGRLLVVTFWTQVIGSRHSPAAFTVALRICWITLWLAAVIPT
jgi:hypothetical protein